MVKITPMDRIKIDEVTLLQPSSDQEPRTHRLVIRSELGTTSLLLGTIDALRLVYAKRIADYPPEWTARRLEYTVKFEDKHEKVSKDQEKTQFDVDPVVLMENIYKIFAEEQPDPYLQVHDIERGVWGEIHNQLETISTIREPNIKDLVAERRRCGVVCWQCDKSAEERELREATKATVKAAGKQAGGARSGKQGKHPE
ncbi:hypothetical protein MMC13_000384 [Lambiella insularis]|nr:hypothetical protein [Lambiella insularis]